MIGAKLGITIDSSVTLLKLINLKLHDESKMNEIRAISETAIKEYTVNTGLDTLEKEIKSTSFNMHHYKETNTMIVLGINDLVSTFEEY